MKKIVAFLLVVSIVAPAAASDFRYVREKANPLNILKSGFVGPGGLGEFDTSKYEEVSGPLPVGARKVRELSLAEKLEALFQQHKMALPTEARGQLYLLRLAVGEALLTDPEAAKAIILGASIPAELEPVRQQMLDLFPKK